MTKTLLSAACWIVCLLLAGIASAEQAAGSPAASPPAAPAHRAAPPEAAPSPAPPPGAPSLELLLFGGGEGAGGGCSAAGAAAAPGTVGVPGALQLSTCSDCDSAVGSCTPGDGRCRNFCLGLVGEIGICGSQCNCCVCPEVKPAPPPPGDDSGCTTFVCRCNDGVDGDQGPCPDGCRVVSCS
ncbi:MAG TPA: hypothetical protein VF100_12115 [Thermoanaerobaculia bacterium]